MYNITSKSNVNLTINLNQDGKWKQVTLGPGDSDFSDKISDQINNIAALKLIKVTEEVAVKPTITALTKTAPSKFTKENKKVVEPTISKLTLKDEVPTEEPKEPEIEG